MQNIPCSGFIRVNDKEKERYVRTVSENMWVSVLFRLTGFGWWEWETAICTHKPKTCNIVSGDRRIPLESLSEEEIMKWYENNKNSKNSFETAIDSLKQNNSMIKTKSLCEKVK